MKKGLKPELTPLLREDRGLIDDPQFSGLIPQLHYVVFEDIGYGELRAVFFVSENKANGYIERELIAQEARIRG